MVYTGCIISKYVSMIIIVLWLFDVLTVKFQKKEKVKKKIENQKQPFYYFSLKTKEQFENIEILSKIITVSIS